MIDSAAIRQVDTTKKSDKKQAFKRWFKKEFTSYLFLIHIFVGFFLFFSYPVLSSIFLSFTNFNGIKATQIGFFNYAQIFSTGPNGLFYEVFDSFRITFKNCLVQIPLNFVLSYSLALFLKKEIKGIRLIRLLCYSPLLVPAIASSLMWMDVFNPYSGILNSWLSKLGVDTTNLTWFQGSNTAFPTLVITGLWGIGGSMIMWLAALNNIPPELYDSSKIDGAGYFRTLFRITIPMCTPIIFYNVINAVINGLQTFFTYAMVGTGPDNSLYFINIRIYLTAFIQYKMGLACSIAWILFFVIAILTIITFKSSKWVHYMEEI